MQFSPQEPVDTLITEINDLADIADLATSPITDIKHFDMGYIFLQRCKQYETGLKEWNERPLADRTWANFKTHFRNVQISLCETGELTINEGLNHFAIVDVVAEGVWAELDEHEPEEQANNMAEAENLRQQIEEMQVLIEE